jgi:hypothetical protein
VGKIVVVAVGKSCLENKMQKAKSVAPPEANPLAESLQHLAYYSESVGVFAALVTLVVLTFRCDCW